MSTANFRASMRRIVFNRLLVLLSVTSIVGLGGWVLAKPASPGSEKPGFKIYALNKPYRISRGDSWVSLIGIGTGHLSAGTTGDNHLIVRLRESEISIRSVSLSDQSGNMLSPIQVNITGDFWGHETVDLEFDIPSKKISTLKSIHISADNTSAADSEYGPIPIRELDKPYKIANDTYLMLGDYKTEKISPVVLEPPSTDTDFSTKANYRYLMLHLYATTNTELPPYMRLEVYGSDGRWRNFCYYPSWAMAEDIWGCIGATIHPNAEINPRKLSVELEDVAAGSPAEKAGLQKGDRIVSIYYMSGMYLSDTPVCPKAREIDKTPTLWPTDPGESLSCEALYSINKDDNFSYVEHDLPFQIINSIPGTLRLKIRRDSAESEKVIAVKNVSATPDMGKAKGTFNAAVPEMQKLTLHKLAYVAADQLPSDYKVLKIKFTNREIINSTKNIDETLHDIPVPVGVRGK